jgi:hypothetical protein
MAGGPPVFDDTSDESQGYVGVDHVAIMSTSDQSWRDSSNCICLHAIDDHKRDEGCVIVGCACYAGL